MTGPKKMEGSGHRFFSKTTAAGTTEYVYDGPQVIAEYEDGVLARKFIYGPGIDEPIAMIAVDGPAQTWYFYHYDGLGSVTALSNSNGNIVERYQYTAFGITTVCDGNGDPLPAGESAVGNPYRFTGRRWDPETGLYYCRARMYSPQLGRFLQPDPIGYADGMNMYAYVGNNPLNFIDPWGLCEDKPQLGNTREVYLDDQVLPWLVDPHGKENIDRLKKGDYYIPSTPTGPYPLKKANRALAKQAGKNLGQVAEAYRYRDPYYRAYHIMQKEKYVRRWWFWRKWKKVGDPYPVELKGYEGWDPIAEAYVTEDWAIFATTEPPRSSNENDN